MSLRATSCAASLKPSPRGAFPACGSVAHRFRKAVASFADEAKVPARSGPTGLVAGLALVFFLAAVGCTSQSRAKANAQKAFMAGQQRAAAAAAAAQQDSTEPAVWFRGDIRNPRVPWREGLTLAEALLAAEYTGQLNPIRLQIIRQGRPYPIDVRRLLRGTENPVLEPGDVVEVVR